MPTNAVNLVTLGVVALNEEAYLPRLLEDLLAQDFDRARTELILVDSGSSDATKRIMSDFTAIHGDFARVVVLDNPKRIQAAGWNLVLTTAQGDVVIRIDAHASIAPDFVSRNVAVLESGEMVCGGYRDTQVPTSLDSSWMRVLHLAEEAAFGSSVASYRRAGDACYVNSVFHGAYRREVIEHVGLFNEALLRTEDNDYHYRIRQAGYRIRFDPAIRSTQFIRPSFKGMLKQKGSNGYWIGRTLLIQPGCISAFHLAPMAFVLGIVSLILAGPVFSWTPFWICGLFYTAICIILSMRAAFQSGAPNACMPALPIAFFGIHASYGIGSVLGLLVGIWHKASGMVGGKKKEEA